MPQLNFNDYAPQLVWLVLTFVVLYFALSRLALPQVERVLTERKTRIGGDLERAREARDAAKAETARYEAEIASAKQRAQARLRTAREKLDAEFASRRQASDAETAARVSAAQARIQDMAVKASGQTETIASEVVAEIVKELAGVEVSPAEVQAAIRKA
jgi:F-type H+-transporting ATPase subunit b